MATNKHALIRYQALDKCFSNMGRKYYMNDLIEMCSKALYDYAGIMDGIQRRQIFDDITYMESEHGWNIPLERCRDGHKVYYRYSDVHFSINRQPLNETEVNQLSETINMLARFKGMPQFEWIDEILVQLKSTFNIKGASQNIVGFEQNPDLKGLCFFSDLFNNILNKHVLCISYQDFKTKTAKENIIHPYYLKEYNNRWFILGFNEIYKSLSVFALDRIVKIEITNESYIENKEIDFDDYFYDVVGVTIPAEAVIEKVLLKVDINQLPYIRTKPIHASQKIKEVDGEIFIELNVIINYEIEALLFGYSDKISIIEPLSLREKIKERANQSLQKNF